jgi:hypothetical protein
MSLNLLFAIVCLLTLATTAHAQPARFTQELCDPEIPGGNPPGLEFVTNAGAAYQPWNTCATPNTGSIGVEQTGPVNTSPGLLYVAIPATPGGFVESEIISASSYGLQPGNEASHVYEDGFPVADTGTRTQGFFIRKEAAILQTGGGFVIALTCSASPCNPGGHISANDIAVNQTDTKPPSVPALGGPILAGGILRGHQALAAESTDIGGGLSALEVLVNGTTLGSPVRGACSLVSVHTPGYSGVAATTTTPCPSQLAGSWNLDTSAAPFQTGANTVQVCASDLATSGLPNTTCSPAQTVQVNNTCTESAVAGGQILSATFAKTGSANVTVGYDSPTEITGALTDQAGDPISGATICVQSQLPDSIAPPATVATAITGSNGGFAYEVPPGPNRRLLVGYRHDSFQLGQALSVGTHARPTIRLDKRRVKGGNRVEITGQLPGPDPAGHVLVLQGATRHSPWLTFRKVTTGIRGGFKAVYRFIRQGRKVLYKLRVVAPRQVGYEYEAGVSKAAWVTVKP